MLLKLKVVVVIFQSLTPDSAGGMGALGYDIATGLHERGVDVTLYTINKGRHQTPFSSISVLPKARVTLLIINKLIQWRIISQLRGYKLQELLFDHFLSKEGISADILLTTFPLLPVTLKHARGKIGKIILIPQNPDEQYIYDVCMNDVHTYGLPVKNDAYIDSWRRAKQKAALSYIDEIISISNITHKSYEKFKGEKTMIPFYLNRTVPPKVSAISRSDDKFVFLFIAHIVILKGLQQLLAAWQQLQLPANAELRIVGHIDKDLKDRLCELFPAGNTVWLGHQQNVDPLILEANVVIVPSLIDNEPHTAVEALVLQRPLIISDGCGSADWIAAQVPEAVFRSGNVTELAQKILFAYQFYDDYNSFFIKLYQDISQNKTRKTNSIGSIINHIVSC
jgi:glycosyltransferase involved in cell wall biosynthesis